MPIRAAVLGASGTLGGEVTRLLLSHPHVEVAAVGANESAGKSLAEAHPNLRGVSALVLQPHEAVLAAKADIVFSALPHGESAKIDFPKGAKVVDLAQDFRLEWTYGLPELFRDRIRASTRVAAPGCFATAAVLSIAPALKHLAAPPIVSAATGSSGSGVKPSPKTHHPFRATSYFAYEPFHHRHVPEIRKALGGVELTFQPHSAPMVRGIFATTFLTLRPGANAKALYEAAYGRERFVRLVDDPNVHWVKGTNFADLAVVQDGDRAVVFTAIDNLLKGGAGQAVQCMNLLCGLPEEAGLMLAGGDP